MLYIYIYYACIYIIFVATLCLYNCYVCWFPNSLPGEVNKFRSQIWSLTLAPLCISREATTSTGEHDPGYLLLIRNHKYHIYIWYYMIYKYQILSYQYYKYIVDHNLIYNFNSNPNACQQSVQYPKQHLDPWQFDLGNIYDIPRVDNLDVVKQGQFSGV